jgi:hypothetical protein
LHVQTVGICWSQNHEEKNGEPREKNLRKKKKEKQRKRNERV